MQNMAKPCVIVSQWKPPTKTTCQLGNLILSALDESVALKSHSRKERVWQKIKALSFPSSSFFACLLG